MVVGVGVVVVVGVVGVVVGGGVVVGVGGGWWVVVVVGGWVVGGGGGGGGGWWWWWWWWWGGGVLCSSGCHIVSCGDAIPIEGGATCAGRPGGGGIKGISLSGMPPVRSGNWQGRFGGCHQ